MSKKVIGLAIMLLSLIFLMGFSFMGWDYIGDISLTWQIVWMLTAVVGFVLVIIGEIKSKKD